MRYHRLNASDTKIVEKFILERVGDLDNSYAKNARNWLRWQIDDDFDFLIEESRAGCPVLVPGLRA